MSIQITRKANTTSPVTASKAITSGIQNRNRPAANRSNIAASVNLSPAQKAFCRQLQANLRRQAPVMAATNTANIAAKPEFMELLPLFVQKLLVTDVAGSVAMRSRQQLIPYFKFIAENTKGVTNAGDVFSSPFVNRQGIDPNYGGRLVKNEKMGTTGADVVLGAAYTPVLPGSVTITAGTEKITDDGNGSLNNAAGEARGTINYANGDISFTGVADSTEVIGTYQYDNETVGHDVDASRNNYGAQMGKGYLQLDEINLVAEAKQLACYWSIFAAFAAQQEYGASIGDMSKEAAISELTAEINSSCFAQLRDAATYKPAFDWDASPVLSGAVVPSDYLNMFKLKLGQAAAAIYQATRLSRPNRLIVGTTAAEYIAMINGFQSENTMEMVGPYKFGKLDAFDIYVDPNFDPNEWVMGAKSDDIRRSSALFGEYMPMVATDPIGLANSSIQQGVATMYGFSVVNPATLVRGKILGTF